MKIADLLSESNDKRMDMTSLLSAQKRPELSMSRIIQELETKSTDPIPVTSDVTETKQKPKQTNAKVDKLPKRRRVRHGFAPLTESEKRVKQRLLVKRSYYRKIDTLVELRNEMEGLETKVREVIGSRRQLQSPCSPASPEEEVEQRCEKLRERYTQLAISQDDLRLENEKLRAEAMEQSKALTRVGILLNEELHDQKEAQTKGEQLGISPWWVDTTDMDASDSDTSTSDDSKSKPILDFIPLTEDECITIVREAYADVRAFCDQQHYESTGASVFGWRDRRQVDGETLRFFLEKTFENYTASEISSRMWDLVSSERGVNRIYASDVAIDFHLVQRVNESNVLFYRTIKPESGNMILKTLVLASRVQIDNNGSFLLLFRSVDPSTRGIVMKEESDTKFSTGRKEIWSDVFSWGIYEAVGDQGQHCRNSFGGFVSNLFTQRSLEFWLMHVLLIAVRCENEVIGPLFIMQ